MGRVESFFVNVGDSAAKTPGWNVSSVRVDNPSGTWYLLNGTYVIPPSIQAVTCDLPSSTKTVRLEPTNFGGQPNLKTTGDQLVVTMYEDQVGVSPGAPYIVNDNRSASDSTVINAVPSGALEIWGSDPGALNPPLAFFAIGIRIDNPMGIAWLLPDGAIVPAYTVGWTHDLLPPWETLALTPTTDPNGYSQQAKGATLTVVATPARTGEYAGVSVAPGYVTSSQIFKTSGTWIRPANVYRATVTLVGGGGGGGNGLYAGGGGAGQVITAEVDVTGYAVGAGIPITIGAGGTPGQGNNAGPNGGTTSFGTLLSAIGGGGGGGTGSGTSGASGGGSTSNSAGGGGGGSTGPGGPGGDGLGTRGGAGTTGYPGGNGNYNTSGPYGGNGGPGQSPPGLYPLAGGGAGSGSSGPGNPGPGGGTGNGGNAVANTGSGGGGAGSTSTYGGAGGSGVALVVWTHPL